MISVCIASHNGEKYIGEQLRSILAQLGKDDEVVVSDDGSTDRTLAEIEAVADPRVRVVDFRQTGRARCRYDFATRNFENALRHSRGDIIFLSDQDDVWLPGKVEAMTAALAGSILALSDCKVTDADLKVASPSYFATVPPRAGALANILRCTVLGSCMAFRRSLLDRALPFPPSLVAHDLWLALVAGREGKIAFVREPLMLYRRHEGTTSAAAGKSSNSLAFKIRYRLAAIYYYAKLTRR